MNQLIRITKTSDLLKAKPINDQILKFGRNDVDLHISNSVVKCAIGLEIELSNHALQILIEDIVDKYKFDSIEDVQECLKKGRRGNYGPTYGKLNMIIISDWMTKHLEEKAIERERKHQQMKKQSDFKGWATREKYEKAASKPTPKSAKDILRQKDDDYQKFKADYEAKRIMK